MAHRWQVKKLGSKPRVSDSRVLGFMKYFCSLKQCDSLLNTNCCRSFPRGRISSKIQNKSLTCCPGSQQLRRGYPLLQVDLPSERISRGRLEGSPWREGDNLPSLLHRHPPTRSQEQSHHSQEPLLWAAQSDKLTSPGSQETPVWGDSLRNLG